MYFNFNICPLVRLDIPFPPQRLFVPMLMIGAVIGRMVGLATVDFAQGLGKTWSVGEVMSGRGKKG